MANESYEDFASKLQTEYSDDCGVRFGLIPKDAFAEINWVKGGEAQAIGKEESEKVWQDLFKTGYIDKDGALIAAFNYDDPAFIF